MLGLAIPSAGLCAAPDTEIPVLTYHQVVAEGEPGGPTRISLARFTEQMDYLHQAGYRTLDVQQLLAVMAGGPAPPRPVVISFDDGWTSQRQALEVLRRRGQRAVLFVFPGGLGDPWGNHLHWDALGAIAVDPLFEVQAHTLTHPGEAGDNLLAWLDGRTPGRGRDDVVRELVESRQLLEQRLGVSVDAMAWPGGWHDPRLAALAEAAGYRALFTLDDGANAPGDDPARIRRLLVDGTCDLAAFRRQLAEHRHSHCPAGPGGR